MTSGHFDGVVLIAHGARDARWLEPFTRLAADLADKLAPRKVALSFMEFARPSFADAVLELSAAGATNVLVVPVFLSGGGHVAGDVPALVDAQRARHPMLEFTVSGALGEEAEVALAMGAAIQRLARK